MFRTMLYHILTFSLYFRVFNIRKGKGVRYNFGFEEAVLIQQLSNAIVFEFFLI